jgi:hypothetical protein
MIWLVIAIPFIVVSLAAVVLCVGACVMSARVTEQVTGLQAECEQIVPYKCEPGDGTEVSTEE